MAKHRKIVWPIRTPRSDIRYYPALLRKDPGSDFGVEFPDFPGCVAAGRTVTEALKAAPEALALHVEGMRDDGDAVPEPSALEAIVGSATARDAAAVLVELPPTKGRAVRFNATMDEHLLAAIDASAAAMGTTRSGQLAAAARAFLQTRTTAGETAVSVDEIRRRQPGKRKAGSAKA